MTVLEVIQRSTEFLAKRDVESPRLQIELLLAHVLQMPRLKLYLNFERSLTDAELESVRDLVRRRGNREPLQHLVGSTSFCGLEIKVTSDVLVPRPETEILAERAWRFLNAKAAEHASPSALDFGTGSGCLAIAWAVNAPGAQIYAVDICKAALAVARENALRHRVSDRIHFIESDGFAALPSGVDFDLVVANPPYIPTAEITTLQPEVRDHDPRLALDGGADGLFFYRRLAAEASPYLRPDGRLMVECGDGQAEQIRMILVQHQWIVEAEEADYSGRSRIMVARALQM